MTDPAFGEEFDTVVDEITDEYLQNELSEEERERVEQYFLSSTERQSKMEFAAELLRRAKDKKDVKPGVFEQIAAFFRHPSFALTAAAVIVVVGVIYFVGSRNNPTNYVTQNIEISAADRAQGAEPVKMKLPPNTGARLTLTIPANWRGGTEYLAKLAGDGELKIEQRTEQAVTVTIPAGQLRPGPYAIQLFKDTQRIPGSYFFTVE